MSSRERTLKALASISFLAVAAAILVASNSSATGYELSIYAATPILFWFLLSVGIIGGVWLIVSQSFGGSKAVQLGIIIGPVGLVSLVILLLPALRGYYLYASHDSLAHIGRGLDIISTGHTDIGDFYPTIHVLVAELSQICGIDPVTAGRYLPVFLNTVFVVMLTYLLGKECLPERGPRLFVVALASVFLLNSIQVMLYPQALSFSLVLLAIYLRLNERIYQQLRGRILLILVLLSIPFSHPLPSLMIIFLLLVIELAGILRRKMLGARVGQQISANLVFIAAIAFFLWISSFLLFEAKVSTLWSHLREPFSAPQVQVLENTLQEIGLGTRVGVFAKVYGDSVVCLLLAMIGAFMVLQRVRSRQEGLGGIWALACLFLVSIPIQLLIFVGTRSQTVGRLASVNFSLYLSPVLAAYATHQVLARIRTVIANTTSALVLLAIWTISLLGLYHSPWILQPSWQVTQMDRRGAEWFLQNKDPDLFFSSMGYLFGVQYVTDYGYNAVFTREDIRGSILWQNWDLEGVLPQGFGYDRFATMGESYYEDRYLIIAQRFRMASADPGLSTQGLAVIPLFWTGFGQDDFAQIAQDPTLSKLYSNGEIDICYVRSITGD